MSPLKGQNVGSESESSLRDIVYQIDTAQDLRDFVNSFAPKVERKPTDLKYERHPVRKVGFSARFLTYFIIGTPIRHTVSNTGRPGRSPADSSTTAFTAP